MRQRISVLLLATLAGSFSPAQAQTDDDGEWDRLRAGWDTAADDVGVLAGLAGIAAEARDLPRVPPGVDSAVGLQLGASPDSVSARLAASLGADTDVVTLHEFVGLLEAHEAVNPALDLLDGAAAAGVPASRGALVRGQLLAGTDDREGAVDVSIDHRRVDVARAAHRLGIAKLARYALDGVRQAILRSALTQRFGG